METKPGSADSVNILVDCGTASGDDPVLPYAQFPVPPDKIDYLFLTHAHIDHIGRMPDLLGAGFRGEIICTHATKALLLPMLRDANAKDYRVMFFGDLGCTDTPSSCRTPIRPKAVIFSSSNRPTATGYIPAENI